MAQKDDSVLGTEEDTNNQENINEVSATLWWWVSEAFDFIKDKGSDAVDFIWDTFDTAKEAVIESPIWDFFTEDNATELEKSDVITQDMIDNSDLLAKDTVWDMFNDLLNIGKSVWNRYSSDDILNQWAFDELQELWTVYTNKLEAVQIEMNNLSGSNSDELARLKRKYDSIQEEFSLKETEVLGRAIKWKDNEARKETLDKIYENLSSDWQVSNEWKIRVEASKASDDWIKALSIKYAWGQWIEDATYMDTIKRYKQSIAEHLSSVIVNRTKNISAMREAWLSQAEIEKATIKYIQQEKDYKELSEISYREMLAGSDSESIIQTAAKEMWDKAVQRMLDYDNIISPANQTKIWMSNISHWDPFSWTIQLLAWALSVGIAKIKWAKDDIVWRDLAEKLARDTNEITLSWYTWVSKYAHFMWNNLDDISLNVWASIVWAGLTTIPLKGAAAITAANPYTARAVLNFANVVKNNKAANFLVNNPIVWIKNVSSNVISWLVPNAIINNAANDVTSEERILFDALWDVLLWPIFDTIVSKWLWVIWLKGWGWVKWAIKTFEKYGWISDKDFISAIKQSFNIKKDEDAAEILDTIKIYTRATAPELKTDKEKAEFALSLLDEARKSESWFATKDWLIGQLRTEIQVANKFNNWLSDLVTWSIARKWKIDLANLTIESRQVTRLFNQVDNVDFTNRDSLLESVLLNLWVDKQTIEANASETLVIWDRLLEIWQWLKEDIAAVKAKWILDQTDLELIKKIKDFQDNLDKLASKFGKSVEYIDLFTKDWDVVTMNVNDIKQEWIRITRTADKERLFMTNSLRNKIKNVEISWLWERARNFLVWWHKWEWKNLNQEELVEVMSWIKSLFWVTPAILNWKMERNAYRGKIALYKTEDWLYKIYVGWDTLADITDSSLSKSWALNKEVEVLVSWKYSPKKVNKTKKELNAEYEANKDKKKVDTTKNPTWDVKITDKLKLTKQKKTEDWLEKASDISKTKDANVFKHKLTEETIKGWRLNEIMFDRLLLSSDRYNADSFSEAITSETIWLKVLISSKWNILDNRVTLKDMSEVKLYVKWKLRKLLDTSFTEVELNKVMELIDEHILWIDSLNQLAKFSKWISKFEKVNKVNILVNLTESLWLFAAERIKSLKLFDSIIKTDASLWTKLERKAAMTNILLWEKPVDALRFLDLHWTKKNRLKQIEKITGRKIDDPLLNTSNSDMAVFLDTIYQSRKNSWLLTDDQLDTLHQSWIDDLANKSIIAKNFYIHSIMNDAYLWELSLKSLVTEAKETALVSKWKMDNEQIMTSSNFVKEFEATTKIKDANKVAEKYRGIDAITEENLIRIESKINELHDLAIPKANKTKANAIKLVKKITKVFWKYDWDYSRTFRSNDFIKSDNFLAKSIQRSLDPYTGIEVYDETLSKSFSDKLEAKVFKGKEDDSFHELNERLRADDLSLSDEKELQDKLELKRQSLINDFLYPDIKAIKKDWTEWGKLKWNFSWTQLKTIAKQLKKRDKVIKEIYEELLDEVSKWSDNYWVVDINWKSLDWPAIKEALVENWFWEPNDILRLLNNRAKRRFFIWEKLDMDNGTFHRYSWLEEDRTLLNDLVSPEMSNEWVNFIPITIAWGEQTYKFPGWDREAYVHANNLYVFLKQNWEKLSDEKRKSLHKKIIKKSWDILEGKYKLEDSPTLEVVKLHMWFSEETYLLSLNIWDKAWLWIWFKLDEWNKALPENIFTDENAMFEHVNSSFATRFKGLYEFAWKDKAAKNIGKRISVLTHEDLSMTRWVDLDVINIVAEDVLIARTYLSEYRDQTVINNQENTFNAEEEKQIRKVLWTDIDIKGWISDEDKLKLVKVFFDNKKFRKGNDSLFLVKVWNDTGIPNTVEEFSQDKINVIFKHLTTASSDWESFQHWAITTLLSKYQTYIKKGNPSKYHDVERGKFMGKTVFNEYWKTMNKSVSKLFWPEWVLKKFEFEWSKVVGSESVKVWKWFKQWAKSGDEWYIERVAWNKWITDDQWIRKRVVWYYKTNTRNFKWASTEVHKDWVEENGITTQIQWQLDWPSSKWMRDYTNQIIQEVIERITKEIDSWIKLPTSSSWDAWKFFDIIDNKFDLSNLPETARKYAASEIWKALDNAKKPKWKNYWYRWILISRMNYKWIDNKRHTTKDNEVYVSNNKLKDLRNSWKTMTITNDKGVEEVYVMAYRNPIANKENFTLHKVVADKSMENDAIMALSHTNIFISKQWDYDGDHLNLVYINKSGEGKHPWGVYSALTFISNSKEIEQYSESYNILAKEIYQWGKNVEETIDETYDFIKTFIKNEPNFTIANVAVAQADKTPNNFSDIKDIKSRKAQEYKWLKKWQGWTFLIKWKDDTWYWTYRFAKEFWETDSFIYTGIPSIQLSKAPTSKAKGTDTLWTYKTKLQKVISSETASDKKILEARHSLAILDNLLKEADILKKDKKKFASMKDIRNLSYHEMITSYPELKIVYNRYIDAERLKFKNLSDVQSIINKKVKGNFLEKLDTRLWGKDLLDYNTKARQWKDIIWTVSSSTRGYSWLRKIAWEIQNTNITWYDKDYFKYLLWLDSKEQEVLFNNIYELLFKVDLTSTRYSEESASINQLALDSLEWVPEGWEKKLLNAAFDIKEWEELGEWIEEYIEKLSMWYNKVYSTKLKWYYQVYDSDLKKLVDDNDWDFNKLFWYNIEIRDSIRAFSVNIEDRIEKNMDWMKANFEMQTWKAIPKERYSLIALLEHSVPAEDKWLLDFAMTWNAVYQKNNIVTKRTKNWKFDWFKQKKETIYAVYDSATRKNKIVTKEEFHKKKWKDAKPATRKMVDSNGFPIYETSWTTIYSNESLEQLKADGVKIRHWKVIYRSNEYLYKGKPNRNPEYEGSVWTTWVGLTDSKMSFKQRLAYVQKLIDKLKDEDIVWPDWTTYTKDELIDMIYISKWIHRDGKYVADISASILFKKPLGEVWEKLDYNDIVYDNWVTLSLDQIDSDKVPKWMKQEFKDILEEVWYDYNANRVNIDVDWLKAVMQVEHVDEAKLFVEKNWVKVKIEWVKWDWTKWTPDNITIAEQKAEDLWADIDIVSPKSIIKEFQYRDLDADVAIKEVLWTTMNDIRWAEHKITQLLEDSYSTAIFTNSKIAWKYFQEELTRTEFISFNKVKGWYDKLNEIRRRYENKIKPHVMRKIDNEIYHTRNWNLDSASFKDVTDPTEKLYQKEMQKLYDVHLSNHVNEKQITISRKYKAGSIIEDLVWLEIGRTEKIPFLEKDIFTKEEFAKYSEMKMWADYRSSKWISTLGKVFGSKDYNTYWRVVNDLYGWIYEKSILRETGWLKWLARIREWAYQVIYGSLSWFTELWGLLIWLSQIPVEFLRIQSMTSKLDWFNSPDAFHNIMNDFGILHNVGIETAIRVWPQEVNAPFIQKELYNILEKLWTIGWVNKKETYMKITKIAAAMWQNPMLITDLVLDTARKQWAISDTLYRLGFNSLEDFSLYVKWLDNISKERLLSKVRLLSKSTYTDITGWVTSASYLYRESYLSRRLIPFNFLMGWGNRIASSAIEDWALMIKWVNKFFHWDRAGWLDLIFNQSKFIQKNVNNTIMSVWVYAKIYSHDEYEGEYDKRKSIKEWVMWMNANFIALSMILPTKIFQAWVKWEGSFEVRVTNMLHQTMVDMFRELDLAEMLVENIEDWMKGDRDSITDAVLDAITIRASKWLAYNKLILMDSIYSEFSEREDFSSILGIEMPAADEKLFYELYSKSSDEALQALIENNMHHLVVLEALKAAPVIWLLLKNDDFGSYQNYTQQYKELLSTLSSEEYNKIFLDIDASLIQIQSSGNIDNLFQSLQTSINSDGLDNQGKAELKSNLARLNEDMLVNKLKEKYWNSYYEIIAWYKDWGSEFIRWALTEDMMKTNQLFLKITSEESSSAPFILAQLLQQEMYEYEKSFEAERNIYWIESAITEAERDAFQSWLIRYYEPLIRASTVTENQLASYLLISTNPEFLDTVQSSSWFIKDTIADRIAMELAVSKSFNRWEINPTYLTSRMSTITNKLERSLSDWNISDIQFKSKVIDIYNFWLERLNEADISVDQKVELKTALLKSLWEYGYILNEDPNLKAWFNTARINLQHKLFTDIIDLAPYASDAKIALAEATGRIPKTWTSSSVFSPYSKSTGSFWKWLWQTIPQLRNMLNDPKNNFKKNLVPWRSGYTWNSQVRPFATSFNRPKVSVEEFKKYLFEQRSVGTIRANKKYIVPPKYLRVWKAETIKVALEQRLSPIFVKRTKWLLSGLPYNRQ